MGRGKDKIIQGSDLKNMSPQERTAVANMASAGQVKVQGSAVVRCKKTGNVRYQNESLKGTYNEDSL